LPLYRQNGTAELTTNNFVSGPNGLELVGTPTASAPANAGLDLLLGPAVATLHVEYDVRVSEMPTDYVETTFIRIATSPTAYRCALYLVLGVGPWAFNAGCPTQATSLKDVAPIRLNEWEHVVWDVRADGTGTLRFSDRSIDFALGGGGLSSGGGDLRVFAGLYYGKAGSGRSRMVIDNLLIRD